MRKSLQIGGAFVGLIVGAGFASGQEIMQYFTSFGVMGLMGGIVAAFVFAFLGMTLAQLGSDLQQSSHKGVIYKIGGRYLGTILDFIITFFLFGVAVVMFAGAGSTFSQMFGMPSMVGSIIMVAFVISTLLLDLKNILNIIAVVTPYLLAIIFIILIYSLFTMDISWSQADALAKEQNSAADHWLLGSILYVSYNIAAGAALLIIMGGEEKDRKVAGRGGIIGGILLGALIILINITMFVKIDVIGGVDMPTLELANQIHPFIGVLMSFALLGMMYNTAVGMFYTFTVRFFPPKSKAFKPAVMIVGLLGFAASLVGFTNLVGKVYSTMGYLGFVLIFVIVIAWIRKKRAVAW